MPIWGNTDVLGQNDRGKVNRSRPTHYGIGMSLHYGYISAYMAFIDLLQWMLFNIYIEIIGYSASL